MSQKHYLLILFCLIVGCHRFPQSYERLPDMCGTDASPSDGIWLKILDADGQNLSSETLDKLFVSYVREGMSQRVAVKQSSKGCLQLPPARAKIAILSSALEQALAREFAPDTYGYAEWRLEPMSPVETRFVCSSFPVFANKTLPLQWSKALPQKAAIYGIRLTATHTASGQTYQLYVKDLFTPQADLPLSVDIQQLPEGEYQLDAAVWDPRTVQSPSSLLWKSGVSCPLFVKRTIKGPLTFTDEVVRTTPGSKFLLQTEGQNDQAYVCVEHRLESELQDSCQARSNCLQNENFEPVPFFSSTKQGHFHVFGFLVDKAGNRSSTGCQRFSISGEAPKVWVDWERHEWNLREGFFDRPYAKVSARISVFHELFNQKDLESRLECKVDFLLRGVDRLAGNGAVCMNGRCAGLSLEEYVPCDPRIEISLADAWKREGVNRSRLRLHVRVNDGTGNYAENLRQVWINDSRWAIEDLKYPGTGEELFAIEDLVAREDGSLIVLPSHVSPFTVLWKDGVWFENKKTTTDITGNTKVLATWNPLPRGGFATSIFKDEKQEILALFRVPRQSLTGLARFDGEQWAELRTDLPEESVAIRQPRLTKLYLWSKVGITQVDGDQLLTRPLPGVGENYECSAGCKNIAIESDAEDSRIAFAWGERFTGRQNHIEVWEQGAWKPIGAFPDGDKVSIWQLLWDGRGRLWIQWSDTTRRLSYWTPGTGLLTEVPTFERFPEDGNELTIDPEGRVILGSKFWNEMSKEWQKIDEYVLDDFPMPRAYPSESGKTGIFVQKPGLFLKDQKDTIFLKTGNLAQERFRLIKAPLHNTYFWNDGIKIYRYRERRIANLGSTFSGLPPIKFPIAQFTRRFSLRDGSYGSSFQYQDGVWKSVLGEWGRYLLGKRYRLFDAIPRGILLIFEVTNDYPLENVSADQKGSFLLDENGARRLANTDPLSKMDRPLRDTFGGLWGAEDYREEPIISFRRETVKRYPLPRSDRNNVQSIFFFEDRVIAMTNTEFFAKTAQGDDPFITLDPVTLGISLPPLAGRSERHAFLLAGDQVFFSLYDQDTSSFRHAIWDKPSKTTVELDPPPSKPYSFKDESVQIDQLGRILAHSMEEVLVLKGKEWQIAIPEAEIKDMMNGEEGYIVDMRIDERNVLWLVMSDGSVFYLDLSSETYSTL